MKRSAARVPDITVYIPAYNVAQFLPGAIDSLLAQTLAPVHFRGTFLELFSRGLRARRFGFLVLEVLFLACLPCRDFRLWPSNGKLLIRVCGGSVTACIS